MANIMRKLSSRKLWIAIAGISTGVCMALGGNATDVQSVAGAVMALVTAATYIITEGKLDAERVKNAVEATQEAVDAVKGAQ